MLIPRILPNLSVRIAVGDRGVTCKYALTRIVPLGKVTAKVFLYLSRLHKLTEQLTDTNIIAVDFSFENVIVGHCGRHSLSLWFIDSCHSVLS